MVEKYIVLFVFYQLFNCANSLMCNNTKLQREGLCRPILICPPLQSEYEKKNGSEDFYNDHRSICSKTSVCCPVIIYYASKPRITTTTTPKPPPTYKLPRPPYCGIGKSFTTRVVNGIDAKTGEFPWIVALGYHDKKNPGKTKFMCGATLITNKHAVTAAHCIRDDLYLARLGVVNLIDENENALDVLIQRKNIHENYTSGLYRNDIAVLHLNQTVEGPNIRPICIPIGETRSFEKYYPWVAGWGRIRHKGPLSASQLKMAMIPVISNALCLEKLQILNYGPEDVDERVLCAAYAQGGTDSCEGDSGGPMMWAKMDGNKIIFYLIGVVSWGMRCADPRYPGVYSRVTYFIDWIERQLY